jgi:putative addiction module CopG family antidote
MIAKRKSTMPVEQMNILLPPRMARFIRGKVRTGAYANASEVVRKAVRHMEDAEAVVRGQESNALPSKLTAVERKGIQRKVLQGVKDLREGRYQEFDDEGLKRHFAGIAQRGKRRLIAEGARLSVK